jgi:glyoxylase-like metal-dependent hydrolase (beta-lactamase superfamily II)
VNYEAWGCLAPLYAEPIAIQEMAMMPVPPSTRLKIVGQATDVFVVESVEDPSKKALIGGGHPSAEALNKLAFPKESGLMQAQGDGPASIMTALDQLEIRPEEIQVIVVQHMHWDFEYAVDLFPQAQVIIQRREILSAVDPAPNCRFGYPREGTRKVLNRSQPDQLLVIEGDYTVWPGFDLLFTPGHTDGHQCAIVQTVKGKACLGSEVGVFYSQWYPEDPRYFPKPDWPAPYSFLRGSFLIPQHGCADPRDHEQSQRKILAHLSSETDIIRPLFEPLAPQALPYQWWQHPSDDYAAKMRAEWPVRPVRLGLAPECLEFLPVRKARLQGALSGTA